MRAVSDFVYQIEKYNQSRVFNILSTILDLFSLGFLAYALAKTDVVLNLNVIFYWIISLLSGIFVLYQVVLITVLSGRIFTKGSTIPYIAGGIAGFFALYSYYLLLSRVMLLK